MIVTRFAPSPTGYLHLGHAFAAIVAHDRARERNGRFSLRIENIDPGRCRGEFETAIIEDLHWLGLYWDGDVLRQSSRFEAYRAALRRLDALNLVYPCFCTRAEIAAEIARAVEAPYGPEGSHYPGTCRTLSTCERHERIGTGASYALRLDSAKAAEIVGELSFHEEGCGPQGESGDIAVNPSAFGDVVLARKDTPTSYHLAVVVDDAYQGVTLVTRGNDLFAATHVQRVLQSLLGYQAPRYSHHHLILDRDGKKFSKRVRSVTLRELRLSGTAPGDIRARLES